MRFLGTLSFSYTTDNFERGKYACSVVDDNDEGIQIKVFFFFLYFSVIKLKLDFF